MANYITLNGKRYLTTGRTFKPVQRKAQTVGVTLTGKTRSQTFSFVDYRWTVTILVELAPANPLYGSRANLLAAYALPYCAFVDVDGTNQGDVFIEGELPQVLGWTLVDTTAPFEVALSLRKRQA